MRSSIKVNNSYEEEVSIIVCDNCNKTLVGKEKYDLPEGTYLIRVVSAREDYGKISEEEKEFCSKDCLISWCLEGRKDAN